MFFIIRYFSWTVHSKITKLLYDASFIDELIKRQRRCYETLIDIKDRSRVRIIKELL